VGFRSSCCGQGGHWAVWWRGFDYSRGGCLQLGSVSFSEKGCDFNRAKVPATLKHNKRRSKFGPKALQGSARQLNKVDSSTRLLWYNCRNIDNSTPKITEEELLQTLFLAPILYCCSHVFWNFLPLFLDLGFHCFYHHLKGGWLAAEEPQTLEKWKLHKTFLSIKSLKFLLDSGFNCATSFGRYQKGCHCTIGIYWEKCWKAPAITTCPLHLVFVPFHIFPCC